jgi:hypothetical protein
MYIHFCKPTSATGHDFTKTRTKAQNPKEIKLLILSHPQEKEKGTGKWKFDNMLELLKDIC